MYFSNDWQQSCILPVLSNSTSTSNNKIKNNSNSNYQHQNESDNKETGFGVRHD